MSTPFIQASNFLKLVSKSDILETIEKIEILTVKNEQRRQPLPKLILDATVAAEDKRFWKHMGFDVLAISRAAFSYLRFREISGASTIEQQLIRTIRKRYERKITRKIGEITHAYFVQKRFSKLQILETYLHLAYFGWHANGIYEVAQKMNIDLSRITQVEAATIAAMLKYPMPKVPSEIYKQKLKSRVNYILEKLEDSRRAQ